jgi:hypothetical protein
MRTNRCDAFLVCADDGYNVVMFDKSDEGLCKKDQRLVTCVN